MKIKRYYIYVYMYKELSTVCHRIAFTKCSLTKWCSLIVSCCYCSYCYLLMLFKNLKAFIFVEDEKAEAYSHCRSCVKSIISEDNVDFNNQRKCFLSHCQMGILRQRVFSVVSNCLEPTKLSSVSPTVPKCPEFSHLGATDCGPGHHLGPWERLMVDCSIHLP